MKRMLIVLFVVVVAATAVMIYGPARAYCDGYHAVTGLEARWSLPNGGGAQCYHLDDIKPYVP